MKRKDFIRLAAAAGGYFAAAGKAVALSQTANPSAGITAAQLQQFLTSRVKLNPGTVDRIIIGNPQTVINKIGTCWMSTWDACKKAVATGVNVLITHEPTFYTHRDLDEVPGFLLQIFGVM